KIRKTVEELEGGGPKGSARVLRSYPLNSADPVNVLTVLQTMFAQNPYDVRLSADYRTDTIVAFARPEAQLTIQKSIEELDGKSGARRTESYPLRHAQIDAVYSAVVTMAPRATTTYDRRTNSVIVNASHGDHERIRAA